MSCEFCPSAGGFCVVCSLVGTPPGAAPVAPAEAPPTVAELFTALASVARCIDRDSVPQRRIGDGGPAPGTLVKVTDRQAERIRGLVARCRAAGY